MNNYSVNNYHDQLSIYHTHLLIAFQTNTIYQYEYISRITEREYEEAYAI
jgi:hypothetical protein